MVDNTNLFKHSPKELVTDAFLTWLLYFLDSRDDLTDEKNSLFRSLFLKEKDKNKSISSIKISKQEKGKHGRPDVVLTFKLNNDVKKILFENKTWTSTTNKQLDGYRQDYGEIYSYFYLKLAYINIRDKILCEWNGYNIISSKALYYSIQNIKKHHPFIEQYSDFLKLTFVDKIDDLKNKIFKDGDFKAFKDMQGQHIFVSELYKRLAVFKADTLVFNSGSSFGRPWTGIELYKSKIKYKTGKIEKEQKESIFWRVDKRAQKYYVRLNQYTNNPPKDYLNIKKERLSKLRKISENLITEYDLLCKGKVSDRGKAESEIVIFFEDKNSINDLLHRLPKLSIDFIEEYKKINNNYI